MVSRVMEQSHVTREFHLFGDVALLFGAQTGVAAREDFAAVGDEALELRGAFVVEAKHEFVGVGGPLAFERLENFAGSLGFCHDFWVLDLNVG